MATATFLDQYGPRRKPAINRDQETLLLHLRSGQEMLVERWRYMRDRLDMAEVAEKKFAHRLVAWDEWDLELREKFSYEGCPIGPRGCHMDAPVMCRSCGDKKAGAAQ